MIDEPVTDRYGEPVINRHRCIPIRQVYIEEDLFQVVEPLLLNMSCPASLHQGRSLSIS